MHNSSGSLVTTIQVITVMLLFYITQRITFKLHTFQSSITTLYSKLGGTSVTSTSQICVSTMLLLLIVEN
jgi:hypothetical protein